MKGHSLRDFLFKNTNKQDSKELSPRPLENALKLLTLIKLFKVLKLWCDLIGFYKLVKTCFKVLKLQHDEIL